MSTEYKAIMEWDRPGKGAYEDGSIRIITTRHIDGSVGACHKASPEEVRWVLQMEAITNVISFKPFTTPPEENTQIIWRDSKGHVGTGYYCSEDASDWEGLEWVSAKDLANLGKVEPLKNVPCEKCGGTGRICNSRGHDYGECSCKRS